jgi:hypothetical protein
MTPRTSQAWITCDILRAGVNKLCTAKMLGIADGVEILTLKVGAVIIKQRVDNTELFYLVEFSSCVQSLSTYSCCCFGCGLCDSKGAECIVCPKIDVQQIHATHVWTCILLWIFYKGSIPSSTHGQHSWLTPYTDDDQLWQNISNAMYELDECKSHLV